MLFNLARNMENKWALGFKKKNDLRIQTIYLFVVYQFLSKLFSHNSYASGGKGKKTLWFNNDFLTMQKKLRHFFEFLV